MSPVRMSQIESAIRVVLAFNNAYNRHDLAAMGALISEDCILEHAHPAPDGTVYSGRDVILAFWQRFFHESPHAHIEIEEVFGMGMRCLMRWRSEWLDPTGTQQTMRGVDIFQINHGVICQQLSYRKG